MPMMPTAANMLKWKRLSNYCA